MKLETAARRIRELEKDVKGLTSDVLSALCSIATLSEDLRKIELFFEKFYFEQGGNEVPVFKAPIRLQGEKP